MKTGTGQRVPAHEMQGCRPSAELHRVELREAPSGMDGVQGSAVYPVGLLARRLQRVPSAGFRSSEFHPDSGRQYCRRAFRLRRRTRSDGPRGSSEVVQELRAERRLMRSDAGVLAAQSSPRRVPRASWVALARSPGAFALAAMDRSSSRRFIPTRYRSSATAMLLRSRSWSSSS